MEPEYQVYTREIPAKGKAYIALRRCAPEDVDAALRRAAAQVLEQGACELYVTCTDPAAPLSEGEGTGYRLEHAHDMLILERALADAPKPGGRLTLEPLRRERGGAWLALHNEGFFEMPNSATYDAKDLERALSPACRCGFALLDGAAVGVYELSVDAQPPEIEGIALLKDFRGRGLGRELLCASMELLAELGCARCRLMVSTANENAYALYRDAGFAFQTVQSRWFRMTARQDLRA